MRKELVKKLLTIALALVVGVTFIPLLGDSVYAEDEAADPADVVLDTGAGEDADVVAGDDVMMDGEESAGEAVVNEDVQSSYETPPVDEDVNNSAADVDVSADNTDTLDVPDLKELLSELPDNSSTEPKDLRNLQSIEDSPLSPEGVRTFAASEPVTFTVSMSGNTAIVNGSIAPEYRTVAIFGRLYVDGVLSSNAVAQIADFSFSQNITMSSYDIGYHTVYCEVYVWDAEAQALNPNPYYLSKTKIPSNITSKPNYNGKFYYVYSKYFDYFPFNFGKNQGGNLYMEYKIVGTKTWKRTGAMKANSIKLYTQQKYKIKGLKADKKYNTRLRYGQYVTYSTSIGGDGKSYFFAGPVRNTPTIKTGKAKKPAIKSVTVKAVKVKKHKVKHPPYWYYVGGAAFYHKAWTEKYYTYKVRVTVNLKKKPGAAGLWINGRFVKGNKTKYTVTLPGSSYSAKKPKGKKFKVNICSYKGKSYGGLSPLYKKTNKIK